MGVYLYATSLFTLVAFKILSSLLTWQFNLNLFQCSPIRVQPIWGVSGLLNLHVYFSPHVWNVFSHIVLIMFSVPLSLSSPEIPIMRVLFLITVSHKFHGFPYFFFVLFFLHWLNNFKYLIFQNINSFFCIIVPAFEFFSSIIVCFSSQSFVCLF